MTNVVMLCIKNASLNVCPFFEHQAKTRNVLTRDSSRPGTRTARAKGDDVTCVWCRTKWRFPSGSGSGNAARGSSSAEGYLNLADAAGLSSDRDSSTCAFFCGFFSTIAYRGPTRAQIMMVQERVFPIGEGANITTGIIEMYGGFVED